MGGACWRALWIRRISDGTFCRLARYTGMVESVITALIYICLVVGVAFLVIWVLGQIGVPLPPQVVKIFWVVVALVIILLLWRMLGPIIGGGHMALR